jgi:hypothetical protein
MNDIMPDRARRVWYSHQQSTESYSSSILEKL